MLYRKHHSELLVARKQGIANPDISKMLSRQWKAEPENEKNRWRAFAEVGSVVYNALHCADIIIRWRRPRTQQNTLTIGTSQALRNGGKRTPTTMTPSQTGIGPLPERHFAHAAEDGP